jgi:hypothetical protein
MKNLQQALKQKTFRWLPKHLNHIAENIVYKKRNVSFLSINELFRVDGTESGQNDAPFEDSYWIKGYLNALPNDRLRLKSERIEVIFQIDRNYNIIPITAYSETDDKETTS